MEIIMDGDLEMAKRKKLKIKTFWCEDCTCMFKAGNNEYKTYTIPADEIYPHDIITYYCKCPCCGKPDVFEGVSPDARN